MSEQSNAVPVAALVAVNAGPDDSLQRDPPRDCVRVYPALSPDYAILVTFDREATARIKVEMPLADVDVDIEQYLLERVRAKYGRTVFLLK